MSAQSKKKILIIDDHPVLREGVCLMVNHESDLAICGEAASADEALFMLGQLTPDLVLLDLSLKDCDGLEVLNLLREKHAELPILILSAHDEGQYAAEAIRRGAMGYIMKDENRSELLRAIRQVLQGEIYLSPRMAPRIMTRLIRGDVSGLASVDQVLTAREFEIFKMLGHGDNINRIAERLQLSPKTVRVHRDNIRKKLKLSTSLELLQMAFRWNQSKF